MHRVDEKAVLAGLVASGILVLGIYFGSGRMQHFDSAVSIYAFGSIVAAFAMGYRLSWFCRRPPTWQYLRRGWELFWKGGAFNSRSTSESLVGVSAQGRPDGLRNKRAAAVWPAIKSMASGLAHNFASQRFIRKRSRYRWIMHLCLSGGGTLAFAITFPLVFGWIHFESLPQDAERYRTVVFGFALQEFSVHGFPAFVVFNMLNFAAVALLTGLAMAVGRRILDAGERATQSFGEDFLPLIILAVVTITGLLMTVSYKWLDGRGHTQVGWVHAASVVVLLLYIPFGKLFHMVQRFVSLAVSLHKRDRQIGNQSSCRRCGGEFASANHVEDLKLVLDQLGFNYRFATPQGELHYQEICPTCRRKLLALNQGRTVGR